MTDVPVNPQVLVWAREERGLSVEEAAKRLRVPIVDLQAYESVPARKAPNLTFLRRMAAAYEIGFSSLLMPEPLPPITRLKVKDFRTHKGAGPSWSPELLAVLDDINVVIDGLADLRDAAPELFGGRELPHAGRKDDPTKWAAKEREKIGFSVQAQLGFGTPAEALRRFRALVEEQGVFVYFINAGSADDWRGLAIYDDRRIPLIVINIDEPRPQWRLFSLMHEYYHLLLRQSAISDDAPLGATEAQCNSFAAHFLMPADPFIDEAMELRPGAEAWNEGHVRKLARRFHVSLTAAALHLENVGLAEAGFFERISRNWGPPKKGAPGPVPYYDKMANRFGHRHFDVVFRALDAGILNKIDANDLTNVAPENFQRMRAKVLERKAAYGWGA